MTQLGGGHRGVQEAHAPIAIERDLHREFGGETRVLRRTEVPEQCGQTTEFTREDSRKRGSANLQVELDVPLGIASDGFCALDERATRPAAGAR